MTGRWSLARQYSLTSLVVLLASGLLMGLWVGRQIEQGTLDNAAAITSLYVDSVITPHLQPIASRGWLAAEDIAALDRLLNETTLQQQIVAFKIWSPEGKILYSPDRRLLGRTFPEDDELAAALGGAVVASIGDLSEAENEFERQRWSRLVSVYVPVRRDNGGEIFAVTEFYQLPDRLDRSVRAAQLRSWGVVAALTLATYLLLAWIVGRGSATIARQGRDLDRQVADLAQLLVQNIQLNERVHGAAERTTALNEQALRRVSADLHDGPAQVLALARMRLDDLVAEEDLKAETRADLASVHGAVGEALNDLRAISAGLLLPELAGLSLREVVERAVRDHQRRTGTVVRLLPGALPTAVPFAVTIALYRSLQEALSNATRHGGGVDMTVTARQEAGQLCLRVSDGGPGMAAPPAPDGESYRHLGLAGMRERARLLGGDFALTSAPGQGTTIDVRWPLAATEETVCQKNETAETLGVG
ncbi:MAG TPA: sensor histidine kinase [Thermomicrobiales bacterium]|jgi:signal transduction histidine kinase